MVTDTPRKIQRIKDRVMTNDRNWFAQHPDRRIRTRPYIPGEAWPLNPDDIDHVRVEQLAKGIRRKVFVPRHESVMQIDRDHLRQSEGLQDD